MSWKGGNQPFHAMNLNLIILLTILNLVKPEVFQFSRNVNFSIPNSKLRNHVLRKFETKFQITQCAMECYRNKNCKSFNFGTNGKVCELNDATHDDYPQDLLADESGLNIGYHTREAFSIDAEAVGPCGSYPCQNNGRCLDTKSGKGHRMYICLCSKGWTGQNCHKKEQVLEWAAWENWGTCSASCGHAYQKRVRNCVDSSNGQYHPSTECYGRDVEYRACVFKECPSWDEWSQWGECSTYTTCGRGYKVRYRNCSNGGVAGVDRYCKGPSNDSAVCEGISCRGMVRLVDGPSYGEGLVEIYNSADQQWMQICGDTWSISMADIVCKQTGFLAAYHAVTDGRYDTNVTGRDGYDTMSYDVRSDLNSSNGIYRNDTNSSVTPETEGTVAPVYNAITVKLDCSSNNETTTIHQCVRTTANCSVKAGAQCKVKGAWSLWTSWGGCSVTCENGTRTRTRDCNHPPANHGGTPCPGKNTEHKHCSLPMCPIDGVWATWSKWSDCSVSCANGTQYRTRNCTGPFYGGKNCEGANKEVIECFPKICPVDGVWKEWSDWSKCTVTCGYGTQMRNRVCHGPFYNGADCVGNNTEIQSCNAFSCPVDGTWKLWTEWGQCNVTCGGGIRNRTRECNLPKHGGERCKGDSIETEECNPHSCAVDGVWKEWSQWTDCSVTCANGTRSRDRGCSGPFFDGKNCTGDWTETEICTTESCPVDGIWEPWSQWDECNVTCGGGGQSRYRSCEGPYFGGSECNGSATESRDCNMHFCPIDGVWSDWSNWTECSLTCGNGTQNRNRTCDGPYYGGQNCSGNWDEIKDCNTHFCPVDGYWESWSNWTTCNVSCGGGMQWRTRLCEEPKYGGANCTGDDLESKTCNNHECPIDGIWVEWSDWTDCTLTCGNGTKTRNRTCNGPFFGGKECEGAVNETVLCNSFYCPVDGIWGEWADWSECSHSCGRGHTWRNRTCTGPFYDGKPCEGKSEETKYCNPSSCAVDGEWLTWKSWSLCDVSCGSGTRYRERECDGPYDGGMECFGSSKEATTCMSRKCPVDGIHDTWSAWAECPVTCGGGITFRNRSCIGPFHGGENCTGPMEEETDCGTDPCPVDGEWDLWSTWSSCNVTCGGGIMSRYRNCTLPQHGGKNCTGDSEDFYECNTNHCPVDGVFLSWSTWGDCSVTCGNGERWRNRTCDGPYYNGDNCTGDWEDRDDCHIRECPIDGIFQEWTSWGQCNTTCGGGIRERRRECSGPFFGGADCNGAFSEIEDCNTQECPVDGMWEEWSSWDECNATCAGGLQSRYRECIGKAFGGLNCTGPSSETQECNTQFCPVNGEWMPWTQWEECNVTCGGGIQERSRFCIGPFHGGSPCKGDMYNYQGCNEHECPIDGVWEEWSRWETCSVTCGGGEQSRNRTCFGPFYGGQNCSGVDNEKQDCNKNQCPVDGVFTEWSGWFECNVTCGGGLQWRNRSCVGPFYGGANCSGDFETSQECNSHHCPVDGVWATWSNWGNCNVTCGGGIHWRYRECDGPYYGGANCSDDNADHKSCNEHPCPIDGVWNEWMEWESCSLSCAGGIQLRHRTCIGPFHGGKNCSENNEDDRVCNTHPCPVDGKFTDWSDWYACDVSCGGGIQWRNRSCIGPFHGGALCKGSFDNNRTCNENPCPVDGIWNEWSTWDECSVSCGGGSQFRSRSCVGPFNGGNPCAGKNNGTKTCNNLKCPVDGVWRTWGPWGMCSATCGGGVQVRNRSCEGPYFNGEDCKGSEKEKKSCNSLACPVDGVWKDWSAWSECSVTCGGGYSNRSRICDGPYYNGKECQGNSTEVLVCGTDPCPIPGEWLAWTSWSRCSQSCGGGKRSRSHECNMTSYGDLTAPCSGEKIQYADCHTFSCDSYPKHCTDLKNLGLVDSGYAEIDPEQRNEKLMVYCDMEAQNGIGVTIVGHDKEQREQVLGYEGRGEYKMIMTYNISRWATEALVDVSGSCRQFLKWECKGAVIHNPRDNTIWTTFWVGRKGASPLKRIDQYTPADYFPGAAPGSFKCACGMDGSCADPTKFCNCDINDAQWREDSGYVTEKSDLPIIAFLAGDTGGNDKDEFENNTEVGSITMGLVECWDSSLINGIVP